MESEHAVEQYIVTVAVQILVTAESSESAGKIARRRTRVLPHLESSEIVSVNKYAD